MKKLSFLQEEIHCPFLHKLSAKLFRFVLAFIVIKALNRYVPEVINKKPGKFFAGTQCDAFEECNMKHGTGCHALMP